jgi:hypothetical protein
VIRGLALIAALAGCKKPSDKSEDRPDPVVAMTELATAMCECTGKKCADDVHQQLQRWGSTVTVGQSPKDPAKMAEQTNKFAQCYTTIQLKELSPPAAPERPLPELPASLHVGKLVVAARAQAEKRDKRLVVSRLEIQYARADGTLDPTHGSLEIEFRARPERADDPGRPIGAPVPSPAEIPDDCPSWTVAQSTGWVELTHDCTANRELPPAKCSVEQVFARAIKEAAPAAALATLSLELGSDEKYTPYWTFAIVDQPRKIDIHKSYTDDCQPVIEK